MNRPRIFLVLALFAASVLAGCGGETLKPEEQAGPQAAIAAAQSSEAEGTSLPGVPEEGGPQPGAIFSGPIDIHDEGASSGTLTLTIAADGASIATVGLSLKDFHCGGMSAGESTMISAANAPLTDAIDVTVDTIGEIHGRFESATTASGTIHLTPGVMHGLGEFEPCELGTFNWTAELTGTAAAGEATMPMPPTEKPAPPAPAAAATMGLPTRMIPTAAPAAALATSTPQRAAAATSPVTGLSVDAFHAFADPILSSVANVEPYFEDDFSVSGRGWRLGGIPSGAEEGSSVVDGVLRVVGQDGAAVADHGAMILRDWVLKFDAQIAQGDRDTTITVHFRQLRAAGHFHLEMSDSAFIVRKLWDEDTTILAEIPNRSVFGRWRSVTIVARGARAAVFLDDVPVAYFEDADFDAVGSIEFQCHAIAHAVCEFDSLEFWDLKRAPGLP